MFNRFMDMYTCMYMQILGERLCQDLRLKFFIVHSNQQQKVIVMAVTVVTTGNKVLERCRGRKNNAV